MEAKGFLVQPSRRLVSSSSRRCTIWSRSWQENANAPAFGLSESGAWPHARRNAMAPNAVKICHSLAGPSRMGCMVGYKSSNDICVSLELQFFNNDV